MNWIKRIWENFKTKSVTILGGSSFGSGFEDSYDAYNLKTFKDSLYLFIGVSMIRETISSIPLELYKIKNKDGDVEEIYDHPFLSLLERPNSIQTQKEFWKLAISYYLLAGETFWYLVKNQQSGNPAEMVNMRPDCVEILLSADKKEVIGYTFSQLNGETLNIPKEDVLHIKNIDPTNVLRGIGVVRPASQRIVTEKEASKYQANTFKNQGRPDVAVFTDVDLTDEQSAEARERWKKTYSGQSGSNVGFFGQQVKSLSLLNVNPKEMDFIKTQNFLRDDILAALHVPKAMITSDDVNLANSRTARINYLKEAVMPVLDAFIDVINNKYLVDKEQDMFVTYESPVPEDRDLILKEAVELKKAGIITSNESRALLNYDALDGGDVLSEASNPFQLSFKKKRLARLAKAHMKKRLTLVRKFKAVDAIVDLYKATEKAVARQRNSVFNTKEMKEQYIKAFNKNIDKKSEVFKETLDVYNQGLAKRIIKHMEDFGVNPENIFNASSEIAEGKKVFTSLMQSMFAKAGQDTLNSVSTGFDRKAAEQFYTPQSMLNALEARSEFFTVSMLNTDFKELKKLIVAGLADGKGVADIGRMIRGYFDDMSVARAKTIARTETGRLISQATQEAYHQSEIVTGKEWLTAGDDKVRDEHRVNDGVIVATDAAFPNGEHYPGESSINCRCAIAPAV